MKIWRFISDQTNLIRRTEIYHTHNLPPIESRQQKNNSTELFCLWLWASYSPALPLPQNLVTLARRLLQQISFQYRDLSSLIFDRSGIMKRRRNQRHRRTSYSKHCRQEFLR